MLEIWDSHSPRASEAPRLTHLQGRIMDIKNSTVIVTGAGAGIDRTLAVTFAAAAANISSTKRKN